MNRIHLNPTDPIVKYISIKDKRVKELIERVGEIQLDLGKNYFSSLVQSIVGQQLSMKAAETIWNRLVFILGDINCDNIINAPFETLKSIGLSKSKIAYIKDLAEKVNEGAVNLDIIDSLSDEEIIDELIKVKGIGKWTAEMFLIFSLGRMDVFSMNDLGLQKAVQWLFKLEGLPPKEFLLDFTSKFKPYRTILSLYLWGAINKGLI
ncbi:DNA-3-methyladenine glycosylase family protein [Caloramator australicus]|uniref:DNA-3-methyladenine glycosylase II n=1 Tax=Caloramator australicus RC3 TaxID=857293 RepID=I7K588_9CLOT|nr:DNA-3-methyladenine glycosylase [Caloramator australicus]CCJ32729.1 DNA-3-methyladenine glycosylase II [Caloramator australicus RC3]